MNPDELSQWNCAIDEHMNTLSYLMRDRVELKKLFEDHLKKFFDYESIKYSNDFKSIKLYWSYGHVINIRNNVIHELGMDWSISSDFNDEFGQGVIIEVYPFGRESDI